VPLNEPSNAATRPAKITDVVRSTLTALHQRRGRAVPAAPCTAGRRTRLVVRVATTLPVPVAVWRVLGAAVVPAVAVNDARAGTTGGPGRRLVRAGVLEAPEVQPAKVRLFTAPRAFRFPL